MRKRRPKPGRGRVERFLFSFMGPPQLGDHGAPARQIVPRPSPPCGRCGEPWEAHEVVRDPRLTYTRCPTA